jgi:DDE superfamily endonuclease
LCGGTLGNAGGDQDAAELGVEHPGMSSKAGSVLAGYQGWAWRRAVMRAGLWPCRAYQWSTQVMTRVQVSRANGTVRSTARRARLRASPTPRTLRASGVLLRQAQAARAERADRLLPDGELLWAAAPAPGATVDVTAARKAGIAGTLTALIGVLADLGYLGWDEAVITGRREPRGTELTAAQRAANRLQAQLRCVGERGNARLKYWKILASELRCQPDRCTAMVKAVLALHYMEHDPFASLRAT